MTIVLIIFLLLLCGLLLLLLAPFVIEADTRVPYLLFRWRGIGHARLYFEKEWQLDLRVFFFRKNMLLPVAAKATTNKKQRTHKAARKRSFSRMLQKMRRVLATFRVEQWQLAIDTGDHVLNAQLYPVNFLPGCYGHVQVNFTGDNYVYILIRNRPWQLLYAYLR
jgi:hypothetical protein